jgi:hypothetical protein
MVNFDKLMNESRRILFIQLNLAIRVLSLLILIQRVCHVEVLNLLLYEEGLKVFVLDHFESSLLFFSFSEVKPILLLQGTDIFVFRCNSINKTILVSSHRRSTYVNIYTGSFSGSLIDY